MAKQYRIWAYLEEWDDELEEHRDIDEPECLGTFRTQQKAAEWLLSTIKHDPYEVQE